MQDEPDRYSESDSPDDQLDWRYQDKAYNDLFKKWRRQSQDSMGFFYVNNPNELTYRSGYGFVRNYPEAVETNALRNVFNLIGVSLLMIAAVDIVSVYILPLIFSTLGADIYCDTYTGKYYGNEWLIFAYTKISELLKRILPLWYCYSKIQMPLQVMVPVKVSNKPLFNTSAPIMMMIAVVGIIASRIFSVFLSVIHIDSTPWLTLPYSTGPLIATLFVDILVIPFVSEIYARGTLMQLMRQFGDGFAIVFTAFFTAAVTYNPYQFCYVFVCGLIVGYFTIRTGSVMTAIIMRIVIRGMYHCLYLVDRELDDGIKQVVAAAVMFIAVIIGLIALVWLMANHSDKLAMKFSKRFLSFSDKCLVSFTSPFMVCGVCVIIIISLLRIQIML